MIGKLIETQLDSIKDDMINSMITLYINDNKFNYAEMVDVTTKEEKTFTDLLHMLEFLDQNIDRDIPVLTFDHLTQKSTQYRYIGNGIFIPNSFNWAYQYAGKIMHEIMNIAIKDKKRVTEVTIFPSKDIFGVPVTDVPNVIDNRINFIMETIQTKLFKIMPEILGVEEISFEGYSINIKYNDNNNLKEDVSIKMFYHEQPELYYSFSNFINMNKLSKVMAVEFDSDKYTKIKTNLVYNEYTTKAILYEATKIMEGFMFMQTNTIESFIITKDTNSMVITPIFVNDKNNNIPKETFDLNLSLFIELVEW